MKNITLAVDEKVLAAVRRYAAEHDTTVNALVREHLTELATRKDRVAQARKALLEFAAKSTLDMGPDWKWDRNAIYEGSRFSRHEPGGVHGDEDGSGADQEPDRPSPSR